MAEDARRLVVALYDVHIPENIPLDGAIRYVSDTKPTHLILGGDFLDLEPVRDMAKGKGHLGLQDADTNTAVKKLRDDFAKANAVLDALDAAVGPECTKVYLCGNHELWLLDIMARTDQFKDTFDPRINLKLAERKYLWKDYLKPYSVGRSWYVHGEYHTLHTAKKTVAAAHKTIFVGHVHTTQVFTEISTLDSQAHQGICIPCLCHRNPDYARGRSNRWNNGLLTVHVNGGGNFWYYITHIVNGKFIAPNGKEY